MWNTEASKTSHNSYERTHLMQVNSPLLSSNDHDFMVTWCKNCTAFNIYVLLDDKSLNPYKET